MEETTVSDDMREAVEGLSALSSTHDGEAHDVNSETDGRNKHSELELVARREWT